MTKAKLIEANNILSVYLNRLLQMSDDTNLFYSLQVQTGVDAFQIVVRSANIYCNEYRCHVYSNF